MEYSHDSEFSHREEPHERLLYVGMIANDRAPIVKYHLVVVHDCFEMVDEIYRTFRTEIQQARKRPSWIPTERVPITRN